MKPVLIVLAIVFVVWMAVTWKPENPPAPAPADTGTCNSYEC